MHKHGRTQSTFYAIEQTQYTYLLLVTRAEGVTDEVECGTQKANGGMTGRQYQTEEAIKKVTNKTQGRLLIRREAKCIARFPSR